MHTTTLGTASPLTVSAVGLGCMGMSDRYGPADWDESVATVRHALDLGVTFVDTAEVYGFGHNEVLVGRAIAGRRDEVQLATKFGISHTAGGTRFLGHPDVVRHSCEASLLRLGTDRIDLYYVHRLPTDVPVEDTMGALAELVAAGKIGHVGLSEVTSAQLRAAHAVHPVTAVQSEYSLWTRDPETTVLDALQELGVGLVPYAPLGRGYLAGAALAVTDPAGDMRANQPRWRPENADANQRIVAVVREVAQRHGVEPGQVAIAWTIARSEALGVPVAPIPGTKRRAYVEQNAAAADLRLSAEDLAELDPLSTLVAGARY